VLQFEQFARILAVDVGMERGKIEDFVISAAEENFHREDKIETK
jgi:hypothetical protein